MRAMVISGFGGTEVFEMAEVPTPEVTAGCVLVRVAASSVNPVDYKIRELGDALPFAPSPPAILGMDFAGTVEAVGEDVNEYNVGDEVFGCAGGLGDLPGSLAEFILADQRLIAHKPKSVDMREAAALPLVSITAYEGLWRAGVIDLAAPGNEASAANKRVLVHGGSGGVGHVALQLARNAGADVYATGGGDRQLALIESLGATGIHYKTTAIADYVQQHTGGAGFDVIYDSVGGENILNSIEAATLNAHIATTSSMAELDLTVAHLKGISLHVVFMLIPMIHGSGREMHSKILSDIARIVDAGHLKPVLAEQEFGLTDAAAAHQYAESGAGMGKVVVTIN